MSLTLTYEVENQSLNYTSFVIKKHSSEVDKLGYNRDVRGWDMKSRSSEFAVEFRK